MPGSFGPELLGTFNAVSQIASRLLPLIEHVPDSLGRWVPPLKKISAGLEKHAATLGLASAGANVLRGRLGVVGATVAGLNAHTLTSSKRFSILAGVGAFAASKIIGGMRSGTRETHKLGEAAGKAGHELSHLGGAGAGGGVGGILSGSVGKLIALAAAAKGAINIGERLKGAFDLGSHLQDLADKTGIAADQILILDQAGKDNGIEDLSNSVAKMQKNLIEATKTGAGPAAEALELLHLNARDLVKGLPADALTTIGARIAGLENPALRTAAAMAVFGKSGADLLPLFKDANALGTAAASIGRQAGILKENASRFDAVSDRLNRTGLKLQGFFVGLAAGALPLIEGITKKFDQLDLAAQGEKFGAAIRTAAAYLAGSFSDPAALASVLGNALLAAFARAANFLANAGANIADNFGPQLAASVTRAAGAIKGIFDALLDVIAHPTKNLGQAIGKATSMVHVTPAGDVDFFGAGKYAAAAKAAAERLKTAGQPFVDQVEKFGAAVADTAQAATKQLGGLSNNGGLQGGSMEDIGKFVASFPRRINDISQGSLLLKNGVSQPRYGTLERGAYRQTPILSSAERGMAVDAAVANGRSRPGSSAAAFGAVRSGDRARRKEVEHAAALQKLGLDKTNSLLEGIDKKMDDAWLKDGGA